MKQQTTRYLINPCHVESTGRFVIHLKLESLALFTASNYKKKYFCTQFELYINPQPAKLFFFNFQPLEVMSRYRDPQLQVVENYSNLFNLSTNICKSQCLHTHFIPNDSDMVDK